MTIPTLDDAIADVMEGFADKLTEPMMVKLATLVKEDITDRLSDGQLAETSDSVIDALVCIATDKWIGKMNEWIFGS